MLPAQMISLVRNEADGLIKREKKACQFTEQECATHA